MVDGVVAEDEPLLRKSLLEMLAVAWPQLRIVAECANGTAALEAIAGQHPHVAFLDIRMPGLSGIEVAAAAVDASPSTRVVFVTAYDRYAIDAFEHGAIDYLLKPVAADRLAATVRRLQDGAHAAVDAVALGELARRLAVQLPDTRAQPPLAWITASTGRETRLILLDDVVYFRADHKYTAVMTADGEALLRKPIRELLAELDPAVFKQIHRSTIVNMRAVASIARDDSGRGIVRLRQRPETLVVSQPFMGLFRNM